jgi:hypothetical protein
MLLQHFQNLKVFLGNNGRDILAMPLEKNPFSAISDTIKSFRQKGA